MHELFKNNNIHNIESQSPSTVSIPSDPPSRPSPSKVPLPRETLRNAGPQIPVCVWHRLSHSHELLTVRIGLH